ncbi:MAG: hypothetical protein ACRDHF_10820 [Tepidiformaceae bacterium]
MAMATDPFDPHIASFEKVAILPRKDGRGAPSPPAHLPTFALIIPTLFGPVAIERPHDLVEDHHQ